MNLRGKAGSPISEFRSGMYGPQYSIRFLLKEMKPKFLDLMSLIEDTTRSTITWLPKASSEEICTQTIACHIEVDEELKQSKFCIYTSWCSFPIYIYDANFGWGKPYWASGSGSTIEMVTLMDDKQGDGIEAWVSLKKNNMNLFEQDQDILAFTS
ncbi:Chloramphenicol acetyltransferase-like domain-containing protein [Artemisia annua]|uniref:Chloramphenicol acetyltransferase-like domain-containing protein n=1 Tax=Artemisia annua TaxID=35608 RepID=A0A2U1NHI6_ARTAN|nr:Chloramphenicol acetyltransferase-like domain-containing protein [Artemisia annua]